MSVKNQLEVYKCGMKSNNKFISFRELIMLAVLTLVTMLLRGYKYRITFMLPHTQQIADPALFSRDIAFFKYELSYFFNLHASLSQFIEYHHLFFIGYAVSSFLLAIGIYYLALALFKNKKVAALSVLLLALPKPALSAMSTVWGYYYYRDLAMGIILLSLAFFLRKKYSASAILLGIASFSHILFSLYFAAFYGFSFLATAWKQSAEERKKMLVAFCVLALFLAVPLVATFASEGEDYSQEDLQEWLHILKLRSFDHFFPSTWLTNSVLTFLPLLLLFLLFLLYLRKKEGIFPASAHRQQISLFFLFVILLGVIAIIFSEFIPVRMLIIAQLLRPTIILTFFSVLFGSFLLVELWKEFSEKGSFLHGLLAAFLFTALFSYDFRLLLLILPLLFVVVWKEELVMELGKMPYNAILIGCMLFFVIIFLLSIYSLVEPSFIYVSFFGGQLLRFSTLSYALIGLFSVGLFGLSFFRHSAPGSSARTHAPLLLLIAALVASFIFAVGESTAKSDDACYMPPSAFDFHEHFQYPRFTRTAFYDVALWAKANTPKDALFMAPVECGGFRNHAQRSVFVDFKYGTMSTFSVNFTLQWFERVQDINPKRTHHYATFYKDFVEDYHSLNAERVQFLAEKYGIDYGVFEKEDKEKLQGLAYPIVYENERYVVYGLK